MLSVNAPYRRATKTGEWVCRRAQRHQPTQTQGRSWREVFSSMICWHLSLSRSLLTYTMSEMYSSSSHSGDADVGSFIFLETHKGWLQCMGTQAETMVQKGKRLEARQNQVQPSAAVSTFHPEVQCWTHGPQLGAMGRGGYLEEWGLLWGLSHWGHALQL